MKTTKKSNKYKPKNTPPKIYINYIKSTPTSPSIAKYLISKDKNKENKVPDKNTKKLVGNNLHSFSSSNKLANSNFNSNSDQMTATHTNIISSISNVQIDSNDHLTREDYIYTTLKRPEDEHRYIEVQSGENIKWRNQNIANTRRENLKK